MVGDGSRERPWRSLVALAALGALSVTPRARSADVLTVLEVRCVTCHQPAKKRGGLDLTTREALLRGGDRGAAVVPGDHRASLLHRLVTHTAEPKMPHRQGKLPGEELAALAEWIDAGAPYARRLNAPPAKAEANDLWSLRPLRAVQVPEGTDEWCRTPLDRFVFAALKGKGLKPSPMADKYTLIRRATFDLTGLPPTPDEITAFLRDDAPGAWERLVDRLLASPAYGERWARHWLDVARYADSDGYELDGDRPNMYQYRDFVIRALNDDLPFDKFVRWSLAGDEIEPDNPRARAATGFCTAGPVSVLAPAIGLGTPMERERIRYDELDDIVSTAGAGLLGLSVGCARCHDHKFDPVSMGDYYGLVAVFAPSKRDQTKLVSKEAVQQQEREAVEVRQLREKALKDLNQWVDERTEELRRVRIDALPVTEEEKALLRGKPAPGNPQWLKLSYKYAKELVVGDLAKELKPEQLKEWDGLKAAVQQALKTPDPSIPPQGLCLVDGTEPVKTFLLDRGQVEKKGREVTPGFLPVLTKAPVERWTKRPRPKAPTSYRRTALAEWITDVDAGAGRLLARVIVNRVWQHHFGEGLVRTPNDFGSRGELPTHPELLDWLSNELVAGGWKLKALHRRIMSSAVYTQAGADSTERRRLDADGRWLSFRVPRRLEAEAVRDTLLAVSGKLNRSMYGPAIKPALPSGAPTGMNRDNTPRPFADGPEQWRRAVYLFVKRSAPTPMLEMLDAPGPEASCVRRECSTVAPQALLFLNDDFVRTQARFFSERVTAEAGDGTEDRVRRAYLLALGRLPSAGETRDAVGFLHDGPPRAALVNFCHVLMTLNEFVYVD